MDLEETPLEFIAEIGANHDGSVSRAKQLTKLALEAGATSVKFQFIFAEGLYLPTMPGPENTRVKSTVFQRRKSEEFTAEEWEEIWQFGRELGVALSASVFCRRGIRLLKALGSSYVKVSSSDLTNVDLITECLEYFPRVILSTGMASFDEIRHTLERLPSTEGLELLHCVSSYPCPDSAANPKRIIELAQTFGLRVGYSDHTVGIISALVAVSLGARVFEKHFTDDPERPGFDHPHAADPGIFQRYTRELSSAWEMLQLEPKLNSTLEPETKVRARRGLYAARELNAGETIARGDLLYVRPSTVDDLAPSDVVGRTVGAVIPKHSAIGLAAGKVIVGRSNEDKANLQWSSEMLNKKMVGGPGSS